MKRSSKYAGLDVHQATTVCTVREESGRVLMRTVVATEPTAPVGKSTALHSSGRRRRRTIEARVHEMRRAS